MKLILVIGLLLPTMGAGQVPVGSWPTELLAGAATDLSARGPWMNQMWRHSIKRRVGFAIGLSLIYEYVVEPYNGQTNAGNWRDPAQRLVGTLAMELFTKCWK